MKNLIVVLFLLGGLQASGDDWVTWGGDNHRNMVNAKEKNLPDNWEPGGMNVKWVADLGSQTYGNPVIAGGKVFVGTNNEGLRNPAVKGDKGILMCFNESDGKFLWQAVHDKLASGRVNDWPLQGVCSAPYVEGNRLYYVDNRCRLVCADVEGFSNGNQGFQDEKHNGKQDADIIWVYDMMDEVGAFPHNLATSSPVVLGDLVYMHTGNGVGESHVTLPSPNAPDFIAVNKKTGKLAWKQSAQSKILHGQWSSPAQGTVKGASQVIFAAGDGWVYALNPKDGSHIWKFDTNPKDAKYEVGGTGTRNSLIATPVIYEDKVYIGSGQDPEHGGGVGHLWAIDASGKGDVTKTHGVWHYGGEAFGRTLSTVAIQDGLLYVSDLDGFFSCLDAKTGKLYWKYDQFAACWSSAMVADGKVYVGDEDGDVAIFAHGKTEKLIREINMNAAIYTTLSPANGVLYITTRNKLYAIANK